jgi:hypothetical protein
MIEKLRIVATVGMATPCRDSIAVALLVLPVCHISTGIVGRLRACSGRHA